MLEEPESQRRAQQREQEEPSERERPIPLIVAAITLAVVIFGVAYILLSEPFGQADLGDRRTVADLRAPAAGAAGAGADGKQVFTANCVACHQATGKGLPGVFPPLDGSEWVMGEERTLANILLHGVSGELSVMGNSYKGAMPSFQQLSDAELAAVASYVRAEWSNKAGALKAELFATERKAGTRSTPFNGEAELKALTAKTP
ncbi:Cytochrome C oxidase, cbb3-type, subunit III [Polaromonas sp. OV174]|uniref:c-type cytochrome n=1 Tax=Polaromonas sp. OV174 TaxID=1855300 RepID=UPI0008E18609|nr:cytochrome c [Polaromonas sp. OV174]SFB69756.1 Cytochrome C oxidase, cbb3-type, subunit III [Polaromonas sp. OV174]